MSDATQVPTVDPAPATPGGVDPGVVLAVLRSGVGVLSWASPSATSRVFGLGTVGDDPRVGSIARLFGARELTLALAVRHPHPAVRRAALQAGVVVDSVDAVASVIAIRRGSPRVTALTFTAGAILFAGLGAAALRRDGRG